MIDLRSDTVTKPTPGMLRAMQQAQVGDDVFGEDPTIMELENKLADLFGIEAGLFCPSGTMTNQIAIKVHTQPMDEVLCDETAHVYNYEGGGIGFNSGASVRLMKGERGIFDADQVMDGINSENVHHPRTTLLVVENTCNRGGGSIWPQEQMEDVARTGHTHGLKVHLDGARIFNALVATNQKPNTVGRLFDSISICLSKGLGAPVGSVLLGSKEFIHEARRVRKVFGGGMRQAGYLAAAGIYALDHQVERLVEDHERAQKLRDALIDLPWISDVLPVETNIIVAELLQGSAVNETIEELKKRGLLAVPFGKGRIRFVTHLDFDDNQLKDALAILQSL